MINRKYLQFCLLFVFCLGLLTSLALWTGGVSPRSQYAGLSFPETYYPPTKDVLPCVGWNSFSWFWFPEDDQPFVGWNSYSWVLPPDQEKPQVGWNSYSKALPPEDEPVFRSYVGWNT